MKKIKGQKNRNQSSNQLFAQEKENRENIELLIDNAQECHQSQSKSFSDLGRKMIWAMLGTIWIIVFSNNKIFFPNDFLKLSVIFGFIYMAIDVIHYSTDTCFYFYISKKIPRVNFTERDVDKYVNKLENYSNISFSFCILKMIILIPMSLIFICGLMFLFYQ